MSRFNHTRVDRPDRQLPHALTANIQEMKFAIRFLSITWCNRYGAQRIEAGSVWLMQQHMFQSRMMLGQTLNDRRHEAPGDVGHVGPNADLSTSGIGQELDVLYALPQLVKHNVPAFE